MATKKRAKQPQKPSLIFPDYKGEVIESYGVEHWEISSLERCQPSCFNDNLRLRKYRITVELVEEPKEVIAARLQDLWDNSDHYRHSDLLRAAAAELGYKLVGCRGHKSRTYYKF